MLRFARFAAVSLVAAALLAVTIAGQVPRITNGQVSSKPAGADLDAAFTAFVNGQTGPAWIGYAVPAVDGERTMCCFDRDGERAAADSCCGRCSLEPSRDGMSMSRRPGQSGTAARLEPSASMAVLFRVVDRRVDRVRVFSGDCELDAGGRAVEWLEGVRPAASVALLESLALAGEENGRRVGESAVMAIALHGDAAADAALSRLVAPGQPEPIRRRVPFWLGQARGRSGLDLLTRLVRDDASLEVRRKAVFGISQSPEAGATGVLIDTARGNAEPKVRSEALFWLAQKAGREAAGAISERIAEDPDTDVKKRAVFALSQLPKDEGVPLLIRVARTHANPAVRKQAFFWLGQSDDPRALEFFAETLK